MHECGLLPKSVYEYCCMRVCVSVCVFSNRCVMGGTSLTVLPVLLADDTAVGLNNIHRQVENHAGLSL